MNAEETAWARRLLAFVLVCDGNRASREALEVLGIHDEQQVDQFAADLTSDEQRLMAAVLAVQNSPRQSRRAIALLTELVRREDLPGDRFMLAQLQRAVGDATDADEQVLRLLAESPNEPVYLAFHIQDLLARKTGNKEEEKRLDEAETFLTRYEKVQPGGFGPVRLRARLLYARGKHDKVIAPLLVGWSDKTPSITPDQLVSLAMLLEELGQPAAAEKMYRRAVA